MSRNRCHSASSPSRAETRDAFREDRGRYARGAWLTEPGLWATAAFRLGQLTLPDDMISYALLPLYLLTSTVVRVLTHIELFRTASIGAGLCIHHFGPVIVNAEARLGRNCTLRTGVIVGQSVSGGPAPVIGDDVDLGAHSMVLGGVDLGSGSTVGAMTLVLTDVPVASTVIGIPGRVIAREAS